MKNPYTLIVIDMQDDFLDMFTKSERNILLANVCNTVEQAYKDGAGIITLNFCNYGDLDINIANILKKKEKTSQFY